MIAMKKIKKSDLLIKPDSFFSDENIDCSFEVKKVLEEKRKLRNNRIIKKILILVLFFVVIGCFLYSYFDTLNLLNTVNIDEKLRTFNINDKVTYNKVNYTVEKVDTLEDSSYKHPKKGYKFVLVSIKVENKNNSKILINYNNWQLEGKDNYLPFVSSLITKNPFYIGYLFKNNYKEGIIIFEVLEEERDFILKYVSNEKEIFNVKIKLN